MVGWYYLFNGHEMSKLWELVMPSNHFILCYPLLPLPSIFHSIRFFSKESVLWIKWPKYWNFGFGFSISPSSEYSGLISFRMDQLDLLVVKGTLKSLLQNRSSKTSIFWCSSFFMIQLSNPYMTIGKTNALTRWTFVGKVISLLFNILSKLFMGFPSSSDGKASTCNAGDQGSIPGSGRSPGEGNGNPIQYSCLENPTDRGA